MERLNSDFIVSGDVLEGAGAVPLSDWDLQARYIAFMVSVAGA
ncbi:MAG TPA: hypothetical protein VGQ96_05860 [Candidatus Eremiobacteraceae bacterium]|nr:hypothetical protein [Candidatus Eremiobacteraceae bacterium]